jgi:Flp pilus assembly protein CpaB
MPTRKLHLRAPSTQAGALTVAGAAAVVALALIVAALGSGHSKKAARPAAKTAAPTRVVVANRLIPKGSPVAAITGDNTTHTISVDPGSLQAGAIDNLSTVRSKVAARDIAAGQQLTSGAFRAPNASNLTDQLSGGYRAVSLPLDSAHGMLGDVRSGDRVDVIASFQIGGSGDPSQSVVKPLASNLLVLKSPSKRPDGSTTSIVTLRMASRQAAKVAFTTDYGKVWVVLRPPAGGSAVNSSLVTLSSVLGTDFYLAKPKQTGGNG